MAISLLAPLWIVGVSTAAGLAAELASWAVVYRNGDYQRLKASMERNVAKIEELDAMGAAKDKKAAKEQKRLTDVLKGQNRDIFWHKSKVGIIMGVILIATYRYVTAAYKGVVVARLPFVPPGFVQRMSHSGLEGDDMTECAAAFIYVLCSMGIRANMAKLFGFGLPASLGKYTGGFESMFQPPK